MLFYNTRKNKRAIQLMAAAALVTTVTVPYVVNVDTVAASSTKENVDFQFTAGDSFEAGTTMDSYFKTNFIGDVNLEMTEQGAFATIELIGHAYAIATFQVDGKDAPIIEEKGIKGQEGYERTVRVPLDENYQVQLAYASERGNGTFLFDLAAEDADYVLTTGGNEAYFGQWITHADVVTKADGSKAAYITFSGHSYAASIEADVVSSTGSAETSDLVRTVRVDLDENNKADVVLKAGARGDYTFSFDFTEQEAVAGITTAADVTAEQQAVDFTITAGMPDMFIVPGIMTEKYVQAKGGKVLFTVAVSKNESTRGAYDSLSVKQGDQTIATWSANSEATNVTFIVDKVENISFEVGYLAAGTNAATTYKGALGDVTFTKEAAESVDGEAEGTNLATEVEGTTIVDIPDTTNVRGFRANYTLQTDTSTITTPSLAEFLKTYFQHGFFSDANIVTIDGQTYVDLGLIYKSAGFDPIEYQLEDGTFAEANIIEHNGKQLEDCFGTVRVPVTEVEGEYDVTIRAVGTQPGADEASSYTHHFTFKPAVNPFTDVTTNLEEVQALYLHNITNGKTETTFVPSGDMKRYEFAVMIARALNLQTESAVKFTDVQGKWYASSVQALYEAGIINGTSDTTFNPSGTVSRQQAAKMIAGMLDYLGYEATATAADLNFKDAASIADYAKLPIAELQKQNIMTGADGYVNPTAPLKRGQMAKVLKRSLDLVHYFE